MTDFRFMECPRGVFTNATALAIAKRSADMLCEAGAKIAGIRGCSFFDIKFDKTMLRADILIDLPNGQQQQFGVTREQREGFEQDLPAAFLEAYKRFNRKKCNRS